jgi:hypothetical protein
MLAPESEVPRIKVLIHMLDPLSRDLQTFESETIDRTHVNPVFDTYTEFTINSPRHSVIVFEVVEGISK